MFEFCDDRDDKFETQIKEMNEANEKEGYMKRLMKWNNNCFLSVALFGSLCVGASQPLFAGLILAKVLTHLTIPVELYGLQFPGDNLRDTIDEYVYLMLGIAVGTFVAMFLSKYFF